MPKVSDLPPAPTAVVELVKCGCGKSRCSTEACSRKKHNNIHWHVCCVHQLIKYICDSHLDNCANPNNDTFDSTDDETELDDDIELQI